MKENQKRATDLTLVLDDLVPEGPLAACGHQLLVEAGERDGVVIGVGRLVEDGHGVGALYEDSLAPVVGVVLQHLDLRLVAAVVKLKNTPTHIMLATIAGSKLGQRN